MALQRQPVPIPLGVGVDTKTDEFQLQPGKLRVLENAVFTKPGRLKKRFGLTALGSGISGSSSSISIAAGLTTFQSELLLMTPSNLYTYAQASSQWVSKGSFAGAAASSLPVIRNSNEQTVPDVAIGSGYAVYAWEDSSGGVRASVFDLTSSQPVIANVSLSSTGSFPKCATSGGYLYVFYAETGTTSLKSRRFDPGSPSSFGAAVTLATNTHPAAPYIDVCPHGANLVLGYRTNGQIRLGFIRTDGNFAGLADGFPIPVSYAEDPDGALAVLSYFQNDAANDGLYLVYHNSGAGLRALVYNAGLSNSPSPVTLDASTTTVRNIGLISTSASTVTAYYEVTAAQTYNRFVKKTTITRSGTAGTPAVFLRSVGLQSKPFAYGSDHYLIVSHESPLQCGYWTVNSSGQVANRIAYQNGGGNTAKQSCLSNAHANGSTAFVIATLSKGPLRSDSGTLFTSRGVQSTTLNFDTTKLFSGAELGSNMHIAGGMLFTYDGGSFVEHGFNLYPENCSASVDNASGNLIAGTRSFVVIYEWTDQRGNLHRSAPSPAVSYATTGGTSKVTFTAPCLRVTGKSSVSVVFYSTVAAGTTYYRVSSITSPTLSDPSSDTVTFQHNTADSGITANELLYTTGGILDNIAPPSASVAVQFANRIFLLGLEDSNEIWYSKGYTRNEGVSFSDALTIRCDAGRIGVKAGGVIDDKIIFLKKNQIFWTAGQGPTDTGIQNDLQTPQALPFDVGTEEPKSVVSFPDGLLFKSAKGWYLLDRTLQAHYIGAEVEDYNSLTVSSAVRIEGQNQIRITHSDGVTLIYDYFFRQWGAFTNHAAVAATTWNGTFVLAKSNGSVLKESTTSYLDDGVPIARRILTPWISLGGLQGFQRIWEAIFLGEHKSEHVLVVRVGYNFEEHFREEFHMTSSILIGSDYFGEDSYFGKSADYGGIENPVHQFKIKPAIQKCESIRFEITEQNPNAIDGAGFDLSGLTLVAGVKQGVNKISSGRVLTNST